MLMNEKEATELDHYFAAPGAAEGTWMVVVQSHSRDPGRGVVSGFGSRKEAEAEAERLQAAASTLQ